MTTPEDKYERSRLVNLVAISLCQHCHPLREINERTTDVTVLWERFIPEAKVAVDIILATIKGGETSGSAAAGSSEMPGGKVGSTPAASTTLPECGRSPSEASVLAAKRMLVAKRYSTFHERPLPCDEITLADEILRMAQTDDNKCQSCVNDKCTAGPKCVATSHPIPQAPLGICSKCGVNRYLENCPQYNHALCPMVGDTRGPEAM